MKTMTTKCFTGTNVFLSRNLVPPEIFAKVQDALKLHGAEVFLCCNPCRSAPNDYHVISSPEHEKFEDLNAKGCNLIGPECVLFCAKDNRELPKRQGFTCCLALDGVKVLASGFEKDDKVIIEKLVTSMGGVLQTKPSSDVNFVIVKNVLATKYKWALADIKKPIVTISWVHQCWKEHRVVPYEPYRVLPFSGLTICATRLKGDVRKEMEKLIHLNGGQYSADLTRNCTHLVSDAPEGDKYKAARKWGHIHIVTPKWFEQSIARRARLDEESYRVPSTFGSSASSIRRVGNGGVLGQQSQDKGDTTSQFAPSSTTANFETPLSQNTFSSIPESTNVAKDEGNEAPTWGPGDESNFDGFADDSQTEDNDLYLSDCRILLIGFQATEMRKLVHMVRRGGGSRYMSFSEKLTHIVVGTPSEIEKKEVRRYAALGVIYVVRKIWLEDCHLGKKEIPISQKYTVSDLLPLKDPMCSTKATVTRITNSSTFMPTGNKMMDLTFGATSAEKSKERKLSMNVERVNSVGEAANSSRQHLFSTVKDESKGKKKSHFQSQSMDVPDRRASNVFEGIVFRFSNSFPEDRRSEIIEWVVEGGGTIVDDQTKQNVKFTIECHGVKKRSLDVSQTTVVSSHWIKSCLEARCRLEVDRHMIYSPLPCRIPFPGFEKFRFCVSQYEEKEKSLLRNLCFVLGAKYTKDLSKKVTHLICMFSDGPKYEAACKWGMQTVTSEWISECIRQDAVVPVHSFQPKDVTSQDREAGLCTVSQYPTQAARMVSGYGLSQLASQSQVQERVEILSVRDSKANKRPRLEEDNNHRDLHIPKSHEDVSTHKMDSMRNSMSDAVEEVSQAIPDVAAAIEDLLAQSNKIQDMVTPGRSGSDQNIFSPDHSIVGQDNVEPRATFGISKQWLSRTEKQDDLCNPSGKNMKQGPYDGFSETQTDSQVVGYEEDLSGIQMIIDRVRTRSSLT